MLRWYYLWKNIFRKPLRTMLTVIAVAAPIFVYVLGMAIVRNVERFLDQSVKEMRLAVVQKSSIINPLPAGHRAKIEALDPERRHIVSVCGLRWFGGHVPESPKENYFIAAEHDTLAMTWPELHLTPDELAKWNADKRAAIVARGPAADYGWKVGDLITLEATVPPYLPMEMLVVAIPRDTLDSETSYFRYDYLNEALKSAGFLPDRVSFLFVKCATRADVELYRDKIDALFAQDPDQTKTQNEKAFMETYIAAQFDLPSRLRMLSYVVVAVAIMAAANTMMMTFRDRIGEYAVFKALGFSSGGVSLLLVAESTLLSIIGGLVGAGLPYLAFNYTFLKDFRIPQLGVLQIRPELAFEALCVTLVVGAIAGIFPAIGAARLSVIHAFRRIA